MTELGNVVGLRELKYFLAVVEHRHFGKAAAACCVSQPGLSMQIKKLEEQLGVQLIERLNKSVLITDIGQQIANVARDILQDVKKIEYLAQEAKQPFSGELTIGAFPTLAPYVFPRMCQQLQQQYPNLTLLLVEEKTDVLVQQCVDGKLDAALLALPVDHAELVAEPLFSDPFYLAVAEGHPIAGVGTVPTAKLADNDLLLLNEGHCLRDQVLVYCQQAQTQEQKTFQATSLETLRIMVANHVGMTLMPETAIRDNDGICYIPFKQPAPAREIALVMRKKSARMDCLTELVAVMKGMFCKLKR